MEPLDSGAIARAWIEKWKHNPSHEQSSFDCDLDFELSRSNPKLSLDAIVAVLSAIPTDPSNRHFQQLAAGPLENLLHLHGLAVADEIDLHAGRNPAFRLLLNDVWLGGVAAELVARLDKYRSAPW